MSETIICKSFKELQEFINKNQNGSTLVGYDVETNAREPHCKEHRVIGFSLAFNSSVGCYVPLKALDFEIDPTNVRLIEKRTRALLEDSSTMVYNCMHEYPATLNWLNLELPYVEDLFVMVKLMMGNAKKYAGNGGLKIQSVMHLNYADWSEDVDLYFSYISDLDTYYKELCTLLLKYYDESEIPHLIELIKQIPKSEFSRDTMSYEYIPYKVIGTYGGTDATVLFDLRDFYMDWMKKDSELLGVDLYKGYRYWMDHHYAGYILERNGACWNDKKASEVEVWVKKGMFESNKALLRSDLMFPYIMKKFEDNFYKYLMFEHSYLITPEYMPINTSKTTLTIKCVSPNSEMLLKSMSLIPKKPTKKNPDILYSIRPGNFQTIVKKKIKTGEISEDTINELQQGWYKNFIDTTINSNDPKIIKKCFNPYANGEDIKEFVNSILITNDIKIAKLYKDILALVDNPNFDIDFFKDFYDMRTEILENEVKLQKYFDIQKYKQTNPHIAFSDTDDSRFIQFTIKLSKLESKQKFRIFKKQFASVVNNLQNPILLRTIRRVSNFKLSSLDDDALIELFDYYETSGIDIDNRQTWNPQFEWFFNYRWYRKYYKLLSTYIVGSVGRESVWLVSKPEYTSGEPYTKRSYSYYSEEGERIRNDPSELEKYTMVLQTSFKPDMAETGRWTATLHTIPAGNTIKGIIQSRYQGGVIAMPDCSQAEVRVLARVANDENLLTAFRKGLDIHRYVASLINSIPMEEITPIQRKLAKSAVFGILYGESEQSFADEHFGGDVKKAHEIYLYFYNAFPGIKEYVDKCHEYCKKYGKVVLELTGRYIDLSNIDTKGKPDPEKILRQSQNFPIQGIASDLAGLILFKICEYVSNKKLKSKPFCIIHDSIEIDIHPDETFQLLDKIKPLFNQFPDDEYGIPMASDMVFSCNMGSEIELVDMVHDEEYNDVTITLKGFESDINEVIETWKTVYDLVEKDTDFEETSKDVYVPLRGLFVKKVIISKEMGSTKKEVTQKYHIVRKMSEVNV